MVGRFNSLDANLVDMAGPRCTVGRRPQFNNYLTFERTRQVPSIRIHKLVQYLTFKGKGLS